MSAVLVHRLLHPIVLVTKDAETGAEKEQELKPAGFPVQLRRPKAKDIRVFDRHQDAPIGGTIVLLERLANLDSIEIENLDGEDFEALGNLLPGSGPGGPKTGPMPSAS